MPTISKIRSSIDARNVRPLDGFDASQFASLDKLGISMTPYMVQRMAFAAAEYAASQQGMDAAPALLTQASISNPVQFLQNWLPGFVSMITAARKIDEILGITTAGEWEDEEIVQGISEPVYAAMPYGDTTNIPLASWNNNYAVRSVVRFEQGMKVGILEDARAARVRTNSAENKRANCTLSLEVERNFIGFFGFNNGLNNTYGLLNDPNLLPFVEVPATGLNGSTNWSQKTFAQIQADIRLAFTTLRKQGEGNVDPKSVSTTLVLPTDAVDLLTTTTDQGISVQDWLDKNYPNCTIVDCVEFQAAHNGDDVFYLFANSISDALSTDDKKTFAQIVPMKFKVLGVEQHAKGFLEDYSNSLAGVLCKRPYAVTRFFGI